MFFKAKGSPSAGLFIIRLAVGIYTLSLGISQASHLENYVNKIKAMNILSENTAFILGFVAPFILIIFGAMYIMGFFTPVSSAVLGLTTFVKILSRGIFPSDGIPFNKDIIFLACFLLTLFAGAGMMSFDALLDKKKKKTAIVPVDKAPPEIKAPAENKDIANAEVISETKTENTETDKKSE